MVEVLKGIYAVDLSRHGRRMLESYVLDCEEGIVLVDTGRPDDIEKIFDEVRDMGKMLKDVTLCLITHKHGDHIGNLSKVREATSAKIMAHEEEVSDIEGATGLTIDKGLKDGEIVPYCGGIQAIHVPGHTRGNIILYLRKSKLIIAGDTIFGDEEGNLTPPPEMYCEDVNMAKREIKRLLKYDFDTLLISHGKNILQNAKDKVEELCQDL